MRSMRKLLFMTFAPSWHDSSIVFSHARTTG